VAGTITRPRPQRKPAPRSWAPFDPFRTIFKLLTSVRVALLLLAMVAIAALIGVIFPQAPDEIRAVPAAMDQYVQFQHGRYGVFTTPMRDLGFFNVFHTFWFNGLVLVLLLAVAVCTANRIPPIVRNVRRPIRRVNDRYFETAHHRADFATPADPAAIGAALRRNHYHVEEVRRDGDATYLFAEKFSWAQYGTFISHLALILFMAGAVVTKLIGFNSEIVIPEGRSEPVFATIHAGQMQVKNVYAAEDTNAQGMITKYHSNLAVYKNGQQICNGTTTVNDPMHCDGYIFHQTNFSPYGVELRVKDAATGGVVYDEVTDLGISGRTPSPRLTVRDAAGNTVFDDFVVLTPSDPSLTTMFSLLPLPLANGQVLQLLLAAKAQGKSDWQFSVVHPQDDKTAGDQGFALNVPVGSSASAEGYTFAIPTLNGLPLAAVQNVPGIPTAALLQQGTTADGKQYIDVLNMGAGDSSAAADPSSAAPAATTTTQPPLAPPAQAAAPSRTAGSGAAASPSADGFSRLDLFTGQPQRVGNYLYEYVADRSITGITVRRDPGSTFIWVATALMLLGLGVTFYLPRRRMWVRVTPDRTHMAGVADRIHDFSNEMRRVGARAGSPDAKPDEEDDA
jgi:cytochrome c biogenesis protein